MAERVRRPRMRFARASPGGLGPPSAPTTRGRPSRAGRGPDERGRKPAGSGRAKAPCPAPEARPRSPKSPRRSAERRPACPASGARTKGWLRHAALRPPSGFSEGPERGRRPRRHQEQGRRSIACSVIPGRPPKPAGRRRDEPEIHNPKPRGLDAAAKLTVWGYGFRLSRFALGRNDKGESFRGVHRSPQGEGGTNPESRIPNQEVSMLRRNSPSVVMDSGSRARPE
jgi:hypothetical protein